MPRAARTVATLRTMTSSSPSPGLRWGILGPGGIARAFASDLRTAGLDLVHWSVSGSVLGIDFEDSGTDLGIAAEVAGGVAINLGSVAVGGQLGLPMAFHFEDEDDSDNDPDLDYTGVDLDLLVTLTAPL